MDFLRSGLEARREEAAAAGWFETGELDVAEVGEPLPGGEEKSRPSRLSVAGLDVCILAGGGCLLVAGGLLSTALVLICSFTAGARVGCESPPRRSGMRPALDSAGLGFGAGAFSPWFNCFWTVERGTLSSAWSSSVAGSGMPPDMTHLLRSYLVRMKFWILESSGT